MKKFDEQTTRFYAAEILLAVEYLHKKSIIYRDLKPENILLDSEGHIRISDFGLSKILYSSNQKTYSFCGTPEYIAPEILLNKGHSKPVDWWTFGILIYEMHAGHAPFTDDDPMNVYKMIINTKPKYPDGFDKELKSLVKHLLRRDLSKRFGNMVGGVSDIKTHRFFKSLDWNSLLMKKIDAPFIPEVKVPSSSISSFLKDREKEA